jgi:hypothetical protein
MTFLIADSFTDGLARLTPDEQAAAKATAFDLQQDRTRAGMSYHALGKAKDKRFSSVRVNDDLRVIVHRTPESLLLCYVGHHDEAYRWAERRKLEAHPTTGAMQMVEVRERVENVVKRVVVAESTEAAATPDRPLFAHLDEAALQGRDRRGGLRLAPQRRLAAVPQARHRPDRVQGDQPLGGRGDEGVPGVTGRASSLPAVQTSSPRRDGGDSPCGVSTVRRT